MQAVILAGGLGTRLRPLTLNTPKPIVPIGNQPFLLRQINALKQAGIKEIILSLNYQPTAIQEVLGDGSDFGVSLKYVIEPAPMGTAGAYKFSGKELNTTAIVLNGDILTDIDLQTVIEKHKKNDAVASIVLTRVDNPSAYGLVETNEKGKVLRFLEKPKPEEIEFLKINTINAGIYVLEPKVLELIPENKKYSFETQLFPTLLERNEKFYSYIAEDEYWIDIGTHQRYLQAHYDLLADKVKNFQLERNGNYQAADSAKIDDKSCLANGCRIGSGVQIINSILGEDVIVEDEATIENSVIRNRTKIGSQTIISGSILGLDCSIGKKVIIADSSVLGDKTILADLNT